MKTQNMKGVPPVLQLQPQQIRQGTPVSYCIQHHTRFRYDHYVTEGFMEVRMRPISDALQQCHSFNLIVDPETKVLDYQDYRGNVVNHFNVPGRHDQLTMKTNAVVACYPHPPLPSTLSSYSWQQIDALKAHIEFWDFSWTSHFAKPTEKLLALATELGLERRMDPLTLLRWLNTAVYEHFAYVPSSTKVDSPIDDALTSGEGVCQDFAHIMIALVRHVGIPCRYVNGYIYHRGDEDHSLEDASHAWLEAYLPELGWVGFDPTNNLIAQDRHIRVAVGRDYADVPPTRGVFRGDANSELDVGVKVSRADEQHYASAMQLLEKIEWHLPNPSEYEQQQQQQQ